MGCLRELMGEAHQRPFGPGAVDHAPPREKNSLILQSRELVRRVVNVA